MKKTVKQTHTHKKNHVHGHRSYLIGCIHGLAGTGAIVVLISPYYFAVKCLRFV